MPDTEVASQPEEQILAECIPIQVSCGVHGDGTWVFVCLHAVDGCSTQVMIADATSGHTDISGKVWVTGDNVVNKWWILSRVIRGVDELA